jgi:histidyl-tRNA synthetase
VSDRRLLGRILNELGVAPAAHPQVYAVVDKVDRQPRDVSEGKLAAAGLNPDAVARLLAGMKLRSLADIAREFPRAMEQDDAGGSLSTYFDYVEQLGISDWVEIDLSIVRGLAYYTGIVFELFDRIGELRAICGGGRYDNLLKSMGGPDLKALGFGMGDVVLAELLRARGLLAVPTQQLDFWVADAQGGVSGRAMRAASALRSRNRSAEYALREQPLARQLKTAATVGAARVLIIHGDNDATVRTMADGSESRVQLDQWLNGLNS